MTRLPRIRSTSYFSGILSRSVSTTLGLLGRWRSKGSKSGDEQGSSYTIVNIL